MKARSPRFALMLALAVLALGQSAGARADAGVSAQGATSILFRPIFTPDRDFVVEAQAQVDSVQDDSMPVEFAVFDDALRSCKLDLDTVHAQFARMLSPTSAVWQALDQLFPGSVAQVKAKAIHVVVDDFSGFAGNNPEYASYFIHDSDGPVIGLDCSSSIARSYWLASLAHEMTHAILDGRGDESWWEEALAQQMERNVGGEQPDLSAGNLARAGGLPPLLDTRRPIPSHDEYGISYLFSKYILQEFGWPTLRAIAIPDTPCTEDFLSCLAGQGRSQIMKGVSLKRPGAIGLSAEKFTYDGLLRYFYVALTLNDPLYSEYSMIGWQGLQAIPKEPVQQTLAPGQAAVFQDASALWRINRALEGYRILVDTQDSYRILPRAQASAIPAGFRPVRDYTLVLNLSGRELLLLSQ